MVCGGAPTKQSWNQGGTHGRHSHYTMAGAGEACRSGQALQVEGPDGVLALEELAIGHLFLLGGRAGSETLA